jgi:alkanesulfonate monooxygenase SsuD/methylene tetrahydromethanopterin reductase-like flavin-dependent oxidoreductase (luciferase family)
MRLGITLPLIDIKGDPAMVRDFAQAAEGLGYHHLAAPDHVLGVNVASRPDWGARNTSKDFFHDPFVMFGFLSACTGSIEFSTQVMILPQRQTALVAKQAASLDVLSGGRFRRHRHRLERSVRRIEREASRTAASARGAGATDAGAVG